MDALARKVFEEHGWPYRPVEIVFLPQRLFHNTRQRNSMTRGMFIPFYPDVFFTTVVPGTPLENVLIHETLHYNKRGARLGAPFTEAVTEAFTLHILRSHDVLSRKQILKEPYYVRERKTLDVLLAELGARAGWTEEEALLAVFESYVTGKPGAVAEVLGAETWDRIVELSFEPGGWQNHHVRKALQVGRDPAEGS